MPDLNGRELLEIRILTPDKISPMLNIKEFTTWYGSVSDDSDWFLLGNLDRSLAKLFKTKVTAVYLTAETALKQKDRYPDLTPEDYSVFDSVGTADAAVKDGKMTILFFYVSNSFYKISIKKTGNDELIMTSLHKASESYFDRGTVIFNKIQK